MLSRKKGSMFKYAVKTLYRERHIQKWMLSERKKLFSYFQWFHKIFEKTKNKFHNRCFPIYWTFLHGQTFCGIAKTKYLVKPTRTGDTSFLEKHIILNKVQHRSSRRFRWSFCLAGQFPHELGHAGSHTTHSRTRQLYPSTSKRIRVS